MSLARCAALCLIGVLPACGGGGSDTAGAGYCESGFVGGQSSWGCTSCSGVDPLDDNDDFSPAIDGNSATFTDFGLNTGGQIRITVEAPSGSFETGSSAGVLMRFPEGSYNTIGVQLSATRDGAVVASSGGLDNVAVAGNVEGAGADRFYSFTPQAPFDSIEAVVSVTGNTQRVNFRVYEFCGNR
nr:hypothetical protein [Oceanococcus sp. HetDA_MAG_MS8]